MRQRKPGDCGCATRLISRGGRLGARWNSCCASSVQSLHLLQPKNR